MKPQKSKNHITNIDIRISPDLKEALDTYCEENLEKASEAVTSAIKSYIGFGKTEKTEIGELPKKDEGKTLRLNIRVHVRLKDALNEFCLKNNAKITDVVTHAIKLYIGYKIEL